VSLKFIRANGPASEDSLSRVEALLGTELPGDYRAFLKIQDGGYAPSPNLFRYSAWDAPDSQTDIHELWGTEFFLNPTYLRPGLRSGFFEIGIDSGGSPILISLRNEDFGHVYYWETDWDFQLPGEEYPSVDHLADSFTEFLDILTEETTMQVPEVRSQGRPVIMAPGATLNAVYHPPTLSDMPAFAGGMFYDQHGFADFTPYSEVNVHIAATESILENVQQANAAVGFEDTPEGYVWHHHQDGRTMMLLPIPIKIAAPHTSGLPIIRASRERQK
jgi:hypothetical protein